MIALALALALAGASPATPGVADIESAIDGKRFDQARIMIGRLVATGDSGDALQKCLADLAFAEGRNADASARYAALLPRLRADVPMVERAAVAAYLAGDKGRAAATASIAQASPRAGWRTWNLLGVLADDGQRFDDADAAYARALDLAGDRAVVLNNIGWSHLLRGEWASAGKALDEAAALDPRSARIAANRDWVRTALAADLPVRAAGESDDSFARRLNDFGVAAELRGDTARARAAYAQAIEANGTWFARAASNLARVEARR
ncbi:hypothetical protein ABDK56_02760 [Sphingomonas sp. ASV193]|uniref:hypothetical protein n=1 Tax=Sphingomonas sp. ASV193 TaxID=3144405 RepID=UPI0032E8E2FE